ncbi:hypothetical protein [Streptomyces canus]|uniref:hypothetical protein n=1 Tax=Streptomyces canus TaxID=58343 RepID=UPI002783EA13|nr:hypothetical protein [Streptomyces canus]MDQ1066035.1 hypothetical protein [Streptomyces canus]
MDTTPRWLDADEQRASMAYVAFSTLLGDYLNRRLRRDAETTHADYTLPAQLSSALDHALGMSEPARRLKITRSRLTHAVNRPAEAGSWTAVRTPRTGVAGVPSSPTRA